MLFKVMIGLCWLSLDIWIFSWSRSGLVSYFFAPAVVGTGIAVVILGLSKCGGYRSLSWQSLLATGVVVKLALFHWYIIPFVYNFNQRDEWLLEAFHNALSVILQSTVLLVTIAALRINRKPERKTSDLDD
jgi:hypothetical protein